MKVDILKFSVYQVLNLILKSTKGHYMIDGQRSYKKKMQLDAHNWTIKVKIVYLKMVNQN